jgi:hypothetical protein
MQGTARMKMRLENFAGSNGGAYKPIKKFEFTIENCG